MLILSIRTDNPSAEIGLYNNTSRLGYEVWPAHRQLAETIHQKISELLGSQNLSWKSLEAIVCYEGPGSFTGLRIGLTVANALAYGLGLPIVASGGNDWQTSGIEKLLAGAEDQLALPKYGAPVHITQPKK